MFTTYLLVKLIHVLSAIIGFGYTLTFGIIMAKATAAPGATAFALQTISTLARISTWAFTVAITSGVFMGHLGSIPITTLWFLASLLLAVLAMGIAGAVARPLLDKQIALVAQGDVAAPELQRLGARSAKVGTFLALISLSLIGLMIFKPTL